VAVPVNLQENRKDKTIYTKGDIAQNNKKHRIHKIENKHTKQKHKHKNKNNIEKTYGE